MRIWLFLSLKRKKLICELSSCQCARGNQCLHKRNESQNLRCYWNWQEVTPCKACSTCSQWTITYYFLGTTQNILTICNSKGKLINREMKVISACSLLHVTIKGTHLTFWGMSKGCEIYHNKQTPVWAIVLCRWKEVAKQRSLLRDFCLERGFLPWIWVEYAQLAVGFSQERSVFSQLRHWHLTVVILDTLVLLISTGQILVGHLTDWLCFCLL